MASSRSNDHTRVLQVVEQVPDGLFSPQTGATLVSHAGQPPYIKRCDAVEVLADSDWKDVWYKLYTHMHQLPLPQVMTVSAPPKTTSTFFNNLSAFNTLPIPVIELYSITLQDVAELHDICRALSGGSHVLKLFRPRILDSRLPQDYHAVRRNSHFRLRGFYYLSAADSKPGTHPYDAAPYAVLSTNGETLQEVTLDMPAVEAVAKTTEHFATLHQSNGQATPSTVTRIHERPSTDPPSMDQDPPPTVIDLEILKEFRIIVSVRGDILAATEANVTKILACFDRIVIQNANVVLELRYEAGLFTSDEAVTQMREAVQDGAAFESLSDALKASRAGGGDSSGRPRAKDVALVLVEYKEESPETWDEIGVPPQVEPAVSATGCGGKDPMPPRAPS